VFEFLEIDDAMADALRQSDATSFAHHARNSKHYRSFAQHALKYAFNGITTVEEVKRVAGSIDDTQDNFDVAAQEDEVE
jgi:MSHA biogenesis protein MshE